MIAPMTSTSIAPDACGNEALDDAQLLRYSRHILLPELGVEAQEKFAAANVLVIGAGGLGAPVAQFLVAAGVGTLTLCDPDTVDLTNLQRQILYSTPDVGTAKVAAAKARLTAINPNVRVDAVEARVGPTELAPLVARADVVLDCCDNFATRHAVNRACVAAGVPLVSGAAIRFDGQVAVFDTRMPDSPCYHCLFGEGEELEATRCAVMGVFAPVVGIIGATQAAEALKLIAAVGLPLAGRLLLLDALTMTWREVRVPRDPQCPVCRGR
jgi:adenylyltransferase/sulfurtransferase